MAGFFPTALKLYEVMLTQNPKHEGLAVMTGSLYVMYANAFVQREAEMLGIGEYDKQNSELMRAKMHYLRGRDYVLSALDMKYPGFTQDMFSGNEELIASAAGKLSAEDVNAAYWAGAGWLAAFSLDPLDAVLLGNIQAPVALLERAAELDPDYSSGAVWDALCAFYAGAPAEFGGSMEKAVAVHEQALRASGGRSISVYVTYAKSICVPIQDSAGFDAAIEKALSIDPDENPETRLASVIARETAQWLKDHRDDYFIEWGD